MQFTRFMGLINAGRPFFETSRGGRHFKKHPGNNAPIRGGEVDAEKWCARSNHTKDLIPALTRLKNKPCLTLQCAKTKNAHRLTTVGALVARHLTTNPTKYLNPNKMTKKISVVPFSNPIQPGEKFIKRTFLKKCKEKGLSDSEAALKFDQLINSGEFKVCNEPTENRFERTVEIYFRKKC